MCDLYFSWIALVSVAQMGKSAPGLIQDSGELDPNLCIENQKQI